MCETGEQTLNTRHKLAIRSSPNTVSVKKVNTEAKIFTYQQISIVELDIDI